MENNSAKIYRFPGLLKKGKSELSKKRTKRINAFVTDLLFIQIFQKMAIFSYIEFVNQSLFSVPFGIKANLIGNLEQMRTSTMFFCYFSYFLVGSYLFDGKTIGKALFGLRVINTHEDEKGLSFRDSFLRSVGYTIAYVMVFLPFLASIFSSSGKGLPDYISQTEVMTDEQYKAFLEAKHFEATPEKQPSSLPDDTINESSKSESDNEQLDLFAA